MTGAGRLVCHPPTGRTHRRRGLPRGAPDARRSPRDASLSAPPVRHRRRHGNPPTPGLRHCRGQATLSPPPVSLWGRRVPHSPQRVPHSPGGAPHLRPDVGHSRRQLGHSPREVNDSTRQVGHSPPELSHSTPFVRHFRSQPSHSRGSATGLSRSRGDPPGRKSPSSGAATEPWAQASVRDPQANDSLGGRNDSTREANDSRAYGNEANPRLVDQRRQPCVASRRCVAADSCGTSWL
jgi:hypothetical protein